MPAELRAVACPTAAQVRLAKREWEVVSVSPVQADGSHSWAPLGLLDMMNGGGAIVSSTLGGGFGRAPTARVVLRATGEFGAFCSPQPHQVRVNGAKVPFTYDHASRLLTVKLERDTKPVELNVGWRRFETTTEAGHDVHAGR